ncbi:MAG: radical SAM protein, partial [Deltaproteobacteria bacterium]|nr:radical SAM protein [Deltaproteobacteria bacterium]
MVENTNLTDGYFFSNHISNYLPIKAKFPRDKEKILIKIREVLEKKDEAYLRPDFYRDVVNQY